MKGLEIVVGEAIFDLYPDISIPYEKMNPAFNEIGSHTLDFSFPWTDNNKLICGFPNRLTTTFTAELAVKVRYNVNEFFAGTLIIKSSSDKSGSAYISLEEGDYYYMIKQLSMKDVNYGTDVDLGIDSTDVANYATAALSMTYPDTNMNFPLIYNPEFYGADNSNNLDYNGYMNGAWDRVLNGFGINSINENPAKDNEYTIVPFLYLFFVMARILYHLNFKPLGTFWTNAYLSRLLVYNNFPLDLSEKKYYVRGTTEDDREILWDTSFSHYRQWLYLSDTSTGLNEDVDECLVVQNSDGYHTTPYSIYYIQKEGYHRVKVHLKINNIDNNGDCQVFIAKSNSVNYGTYDLGHLPAGVQELDAEIKFWVSPAEIGDWLMVGVAIVTGVNGLSLFVNSGSWAIISNDSENALNKYSKTLTYSNHVPNKSVGDFVKNVEKTFGFVSFVDNIKREHRMLSYNDLFNGSVINDISENVLQGLNIEFERLKTIQGFTFNNDGFTSENLVKYSQYEYLGEYATADDFPAPIRTGLCAKITNLNEIWITQFSETGEIIEWIFLTDNWFDLTTGISTDSEMNLVSEGAPLFQGIFDDCNISKIKNCATSVTFNTGENEAPLRFMFFRGLVTIPDTGGEQYPKSHFEDISGNLSLTTESINENFMGKYIDWLTSPHKTVSYQAVFTVTEIRNLKLWEKYRIGNSIGFIKSIKTNMKKDKIDICTVEFLPI